VSEHLIWLVHLLDRHAGAAQAIAATLTFIASAVLVGITCWYVRLTSEANALTTEQLALARNQLAASIEANETPYTPYVTVRQQPRPGEDVIIDGPDAAQVAQFPEVQLINLGPGAAINVHYEFRQVDADDGIPGINHPENLPRLTAGHAWRTAVARGSLDNRNFIFSAAYESLSHRRYQTAMRLERGVILNHRYVKLPAAE
jgi:hypothetical protein